MDKDPFEQELRELPWRKPPPELEERLFTSPLAYQQPVGARRVWPQTTLAWASAAMLAITALGLHFTQTKQGPDALSRSEIHMVEQKLDYNVFDFTLHEPDAWPNTVELKVLARSDHQ